MFESNGVNIMCGARKFKEHGLKLLKVSKGRKAWSNFNHDLSSSVYEKCSRFTRHIS